MYGMCRQHETVKKTAKMGSSRPNSGNDKTTVRSFAICRYEYVPHLCDSGKKRLNGDEKTAAVWCDDDDDDDA